MEISWNERARRDVDEIGGYIAQQSPIQADRVCGMVEQAPEVLRLYPDFGTVVSDFDDPMVREIRVFKYRIIYRIREDENEIEIMTVVHGARQLTGDMVE